MAISLLNNDIERVMYVCEEWCSTCCHPRLSKCYAFEEDDVQAVPVVLCESIKAIRLITIYIGMKLQELVLLFNV